MEAKNFIIDNLFISKIYNRSAVDRLSEVEAIKLLDRINKRLPKDWKNEKLTRIGPINGATHKYEANVRICRMNGCNNEFINGIVVDGDNILHIPPFDDYKDRRHTPDGIILDYCENCIELCGCPGKGGRDQYFTFYCRLCDKAQCKKHDYCNGSKGDICGECSSCLKFGKLFMKLVESDRNYSIERILKELRM